MGDHVERALKEMDLVTAARFGRETAHFRHQHRVGQRFGQHAPLVRVQPPLWRHHVNEGQRVSPGCF
jgi:hypothetical protein